MKSAMQELIDWAISLQYNQHQSIDWIVIKDKAESLLETEKQQMDKVSGDWFNEGASYMHDGKRKYETFEQYYTSTYGSKGSGMSEKPTNI